MTSTSNGNTDVTYLSQRALAKFLGISVSTVQRLRTECPDFPKKRAFSYRTKGWLKGEIVEWAQARPAA